MHGATATVELHRRISTTALSGPETAASAARWDTLETLDVWWDCKAAAADATGCGATIQPTRQPVIA